MKILIRQIREKKDVSRKKLSEITNISLRALVNYESGDRSPTLNHLKSISDALNCTIEDLYSDY